MQRTDPHYVGSDPAPSHNGTNTVPGEFEVPYASLPWKDE